MSKGVTVENKVSDPMYGTDSGAFGGLHRESTQRSKPSFQGLLGCAPNQQVG